MGAVDATPYTDPSICHSRAVKAGRATHATLTTLIILYAKSGRLASAAAVFREIPSPCVVSWTALISAHSNSPHALSHFVSMLRRNEATTPARPNERTFSSLFKTCASLSFLRFGLQLHTLSFKLCLSSLRFCGSALVSFYSKCRLTDDAWKVFDEMPQRDEVCYGSMIVGFAQNSRLVEALQLFSSMKSRGVASTESTVSGALSAAAGLAGLKHCKVIHAHAIVTGHDQNEVVGTALIDGYGKCGIATDAKLIFDELLSFMSLVGWNALMACYAQQGDHSAVLEHFNEMISRGFDPDEYSFLALLTSFCNAGLADEAEQWMMQMREYYGLEPWIEHYTCLIGALGRAGKLNEAKRIALTMPVKPDNGVWRTLLVASSLHGDADVAWSMSQRLLEINPFDDSAYIIAANTFARSGRWSEASRIKKMMEDGRVRKEDGVSWIEV